MATLTLPVEVIYTTSCAFIDLIVLFLNPIIIGVIYHDRQLRRQPSIIYIANLALVDLCLAGVNFINILFRFMHVTRTFPICSIFHGYLPLSLITASLLFMFTNSIDRFIFIRMSLKYHSIMKPRIARRVALCIWISSAAFPLLPNVIFDHFWEYSACAYMSDSKSYAYAHIPLNIIFFTTIIITPLMFISVFRVVKNSRRLRHVPERSCSMDSLTTTMSSPTLNMSFSTLPPISELIPYEHEHCGDTDTGEADRSCQPSESRNNLLTEQEQHSIPATRPLASDDIPPDVISSHVIVLDNETHGQRNTDESPENEEDIHFPNTLRNTPRTKRHLHFEATFNENTGWIYPAIPPVVKESHESSLDVVCDADDNAKIVFRNCVVEDAGIVKFDNFSVERPPDELRLHGASVFPENSSQSISVVGVDNNNLNDGHKSEEIDHEKIKPCRRHGDKTLLETTAKRHRKLRSFLYKGGTKFGHDFVKTKKRFKLRRRKSNVSTIPTEPLKMLNFKLEKWYMNVILKPDTPQQETSFSVPQSNYSVPSGDLPTESNENSKEKHLNHLMNVRLSVLHFGALRAPRNRRRTTSTSDNSSIFSTESTSSFSLETTDSTTTTENTTSFQKTGDLNLDSAQSPNKDYKASAPLKRRVSSFTDLRSSSDQFITPISRLGSYRRARTVSASDDLIPPSERPQRPNRLSFRNRSQCPIPDSPRLQSRVYDRNISTTSTSSSIPFGASTYSGRDIRTLKILFLMFCVYITLWLPSFIIQTLRYFSYSVNIEVAVIGYTFGVSNSVFNFFVYPMRIPKLRVSFKQLLKVAIADFKRNVRWLMSVTRR